LCGLVDVAVFSILEVEQRAVMSLLDLSDQQVHWLCTGDSFHYGTYLNDKGQKLRVALFGTKLAGNPTMASLAAIVHSELLPRLSVLTGICAGLKSRPASDDRPEIHGLRIGAVVVPREVVDYSHAVVTGATELGNPDSIPAHKQYEIQGLGLALQKQLTLDQKTWILNKRDAYMRGQQRHWKGSLDSGSFREPDNKSRDEWNEFLRKSVCDPQTFSVSDDDLASSNLLLKNEVVLQDLNENRHRRVKAADMEAAGFSVASKACSADWFVIRGVSDLGDSVKSDLFQTYASANAAAYLTFTLHSLDANLLRNALADNLNAARLEQAQLAVTSVLESFVTIIHDHVGKRVNLEVYWVGNSVSGNDPDRQVVGGVVRDGRMKAERAGALNRFEPNRFFPFKPSKGDPRVVAQVGDPELKLDEKFHEIGAEEKSPLKWVYAVPLFEEHELRGERVGVLCCTSIDPLTASDPTQEVLDREKLKIRALVGTVRQVVTSMGIITDCWNLVRREVQ
jgi:nucleoside phosphorylase